MEVDAHKLVVYIPDTRGVTVSRFGGGNLKLGPGIYTYSRLPGMAGVAALGSGYNPGMPGTCPGATSECQEICYAARPVAEDGAVAQMWLRNSLTEGVPPLPPDCKTLRIHVSGDFTSSLYIDNWINRLRERSDVQAWAYTRSWRCDWLLHSLERLRALPNMQLFASMDKSTVELPPKGWRCAWIDDDARVRRAENGRFVEHRWIDTPESDWQSDLTGVPQLGYVCPEETKRRADCASCGYCFKGQKHDVIFLKH